MFKTLQAVRYNNEPLGMAYGGYIYGVSCDMATTSDPTKITLNIISENGEYNIGPADLDVTSTGPKTLSFGTDSNIVTFYNMYVYKYNYNSSPSSKTLTVNLIDNSLALDKIFVGLINWHDTSLAIQESLSYQFEVACDVCNSLYPRKQAGYQGAVRRSTWKTHINNIRVNPQRIIDGGYIILGQEQWSEKICDIGKVEYSFEELCTALDHLGFVHELRSVNRSKHYLANYTGTLREVLNAWGADFSFSFMMDPLVRHSRIVVTDLTVPRVINLDKITKILNENFHPNSPDKGLVRSYSESFTLENTYRQETIARIVKPASNFARENTSYKRMEGRIVTIRDAIGFSFHHQRTDEEFMTSIALAKYNPASRLIWLSDRAAELWTRNLRVVSDVRNIFPSLGFIPATEGWIDKLNPFFVRKGITSDDVINKIKGQLILKFGENDAKTSNHPIWSNVENYDIFIGVYNKEFQNYALQYEKELADFIGKYGYWYGNKFYQETKSFDPPAGVTPYVGMINPPPSYKECPDFFSAWDKQKFYSEQASITTRPESKPYKGRTYPFQNILKANSWVFDATHGGAQSESSEGADYIFNIEENSWGTNQEQIDKLFENKYILDNQQEATNWYSNPSPGQSDLDNYKPIYGIFTGSRQLDVDLRSILPGYDEHILKNDESRPGYFPGIAIIPKIEKMMIKNVLNNVEERVLSVETINNHRNPIVFENTRAKVIKHAAGLTDPEATDCVLWCEVDIMHERCKCEPEAEQIEGFDPAGGWNATTIRVSHLGSSVPIIFPVQTPYIGYWKSNTVYKGTYPKIIEIKGACPSELSIGNVMETRVLDVDLTQDLDPSLTGGRFVSQFLVRNSLRDTPVTLEEYYNFLNPINLSVDSPAQSINIKLDGLEFSKLAPEFINPMEGLTSFNITVDSEGVSCDLSFNTRPIKLPKKEVIFQKLGPRATQTTGSVNRAGSSRIK